MHLVKMAARFLSKDAENLFIKVLPQVIRTAKNYKGFIAVDFWRSVSDPDLLLEDSYWADESAAGAWRKDPFHQHLQKLAYSSLIMENTTTRWDLKGDVFVYQKCPICGTSDTIQTTLEKWSYATQKADKCKTCGFAFPVTPDLTSPNVNLPRRVVFGMDVIK